VIIYFVQIEPGEEEYFGAHLADHALHSVHKLQEVGADAQIVSVFIDESVDAAFLDAHPALRLVATRSTSTDHIDIEACAARGVEVCHVPHYAEETIAEHVFALILALARRLRELMRLPKGGKFSYAATRGFELRGKTLGVIGMGRIGQRVATLAHAFQMQVLGYDIHPVPALERTLRFRWVSLDDLLASSDILSLHAPLSPATYHLLNADTIARTKRGVLIINTARGALVDTSALRDALETGHVGGAGLDVLQDERVLRRRAESVIADDILRQLRTDGIAREARDADRVRELEELMLGDAVLARPNVVFTPHVAFNTHEAIQRLNETVLANIRATIEGKPQNRALPAKAAS